MLSKIIGMLFQNWLLGRSRVFSIWLFGTEAVAAVLIAALIFTGGIPGIPLFGFGFVWYASVCGVQFFNWERKRSLKNSEAWEAPRFAKVCALIYVIGYAVIGIGLLAIGSLTVRIIGVAVFGFGAIQLYTTWKGDWPGDLA